MKQFVKALNKEGYACFKYIQEKFPYMSAEKVKEGVFVGPQITQFLSIMTDVEKKAWLSIAEVVSKFVGNTKDPDYKTIVENTVSMCLNRYPDNCPNRHNPEWTQSRMDTIPNGHNPEWTQSRMDTIPNGHNPEWTQSRMDTIPNGHNPEWTQSRMDTIPNEHLQLYTVVTLVFNSYCLVRSLLRRRGFKQKLILCMNLSDL